MSSQLPQFDLEPSVPAPVKLLKALGQLGFDTPLKRVIAGFGAGSLLAYMFKSPVMFDEVGPRPFILLSDKGDERATYLPWYAPGAIFAFLFGVMI